MERQALIKALVIHGAVIAFGVVAYQACSSWALKAWNSYTQSVMQSENMRLLENVRLHCGDKSCRNGDKPLTEAQTLAALYTLNNQLDSCSATLSTIQAMAMQSE